MRTGICPFTGGLTWFKNQSSDIRLQAASASRCAGAKAVGKADPTGRLEVSIILRRHNGAALTERVKKLAGQEDVGGISAARSSTSVLAPPLATSPLSKNLPMRMGLLLCRSIGEAHCCPVRHGGAVQRRVRCGSAAVRV